MMTSFANTEYNGHKAGTNILIHYEIYFELNQGNQQVRNSKNDKNIISIIQDSSGLWLLLYCWRKLFRHYKTVATSVFDFIYEVYYLKKVVHTNMTNVHLKGMLDFHITANICFE